MMSPTKAVIFDVDGTLAETERDGHRVCFNRAFAEAGLDWNWSVSLYGELLEVAGGKERIQHYAQKYHPNFLPTHRLEVLAAALHRNKSRHYQTLLRQGEIGLRPGVERLLRSAQQENIRLAIATTSSLASVLTLLETTLGAESMTWFDVIAAGDVVPQKKPAPDIYNYVLDKMALSPQDCLVIEDSHQGLTAARSAGIRTVVTCNAYTRSQDFSGAMLVLDHLGEPEFPCTLLAGAIEVPSYFEIGLAEHLG
jgi:HAD superfamily hydrolase (TIGR01509 family)